MIPIPRAGSQYSQYIFVQESEDSAKMTGSILALTTRGRLHPPPAALRAAARRRYAELHCTKCARTRNYRVYPAGNCGSSSPKAARASSDSMAPSGVGLRDEQESPAVKVQRTSVVMRAPDGEVGWVLLELQGTIEARSGGTLDGMQFARLVQEVRLRPEHL